MAADPTDLTGLLKAWSAGDQDALEQLTPLVYDELRAHARRYMRSERSGATLQSTALVHEVYLRLLDADRVDWNDRVHFFALSAQLMRRILVLRAGHLAGELAREEFSQPNLMRLMAGVEAQAA